MRFSLVLGLLALTLGLGTAFAADEAKPNALTIIVMDPLAAPLSCPCVKGYAQRDYDQLGKYLETKLGRPVQVFYDESLPVALKKKTAGKADLVIGKCSVVRHDADRAGMKFNQVAALTGKDGLTTQTGWIVVPSADPAKTVADLKGYRIYFGPAECEEKHQAAVALLKEHGVDVPEKRDICAACTEGAELIIEKGPKAKNATVISSYAAPLLEGCGHVKKGDLRVLAKTEPVPFIGAFLNERLSGEDREAIGHALLKVGEESTLLQALETKAGFMPMPTEAAKKK